jgi:hypothetical protein
MFRMTLGSAGQVHRHHCGRQGAVTADDVAVYADYLRDPAHLRATLAWFRT